MEIIGSGRWQLVKSIGHLVLLWAGDRKIFTFLISSYLSIHMLPSQTSLVWIFQPFSLQAPLQPVEVFAIDLEAIYILT